MIRAVLFDVDGVLLDSEEANAVFYRNFLEGYGYRDLTAADVARGHTLTLFEAIKVMTGEPEARVQEIWEDARLLPGYPYDLLRLPPGSEAALTALAKRYSLGIVTSRIREGIDSYFEFSGLDGLFNVALSYEDYAHPKPHPDPLLTACTRLGVEPAETVYVGDALTDFESALAAGVHFIAFGSAIPNAERRVTTFDEIAPLVRALEDD